MVEATHENLPPRKQFARWIDGCKKAMRAWLPCLQRYMGSCWRNAALRERAARNAHDKYAVAVEKDGTVIGHLPKKVSRVCALYI